MGYRGRPDLEDLLPKDYAPTIVIVGTGPVGIELANQLVEQQWHGHIKLFGQANYRPYRRDLLPKYVEGVASKRDIKIALQKHPFLVQHTGSKITQIDTKHRQVQDEQGHWHYYDKLVLATGASIQLPNIPGTNLQGVHGFRNMKDAPLLMQNCAGSQHIVVVGGGAIGLETARAMQGFAKQVTLVQPAPSLMPSVLDPNASRFVQLRASQLGIRFKLSRQVTEIFGVEQVHGIRLSGGENLACDKVIFTDQTKANTALAKQLGVEIGTGVCIDNNMQTSIEHVYAIGECSQVGKQQVTNKFIALAQARQLASSLAQCKPLEFIPPNQVTQTEVLGIPILSVSDITNLIDNAVVWQYQGESSFRQIWLQKGRMVGAVGIGHWLESDKVVAAVQEKRQLWPWHKIRFCSSGNLHFDKADQPQKVPLTA